MIINQSDISDNKNFRSEFNNCDGVKVLPPRKGENGQKVWFWEIDPKRIVWDTLNTKFAQRYPEEIRKLEKLLKVKEIEHFEDLFTDISKTVNPAPKQYRVEGDIRKVNVINGLSIYTMIDSQNLNQTIRIVVPVGKIPPENFVDRRVIVTGRLEIYSKYAQFQLVANESQIEDIGICSRKQKLMDWTEDLKDILLSNDKEIIYTPFRHIGVIGQKDSRGMTDFQNHLSKKAERNVQYEYRYIPKNEKMKTDIILQYLAEFNAEAENPCDYICIVRGGDDPERLLQYSQPQFVRAIANSRIPVITGIAHDKDSEELLCDRVTELNGLNGGTPTGAAEILNLIAGREDKQKRDKEYKQNLEQIKRKAGNDKQRAAMLEDECQRLRMMLEEAQETIERLQQQLNKPKRTGILSFLFGDKKEENEDEAARLAKRVRELFAENNALKEQLRRR